METYDLNVYILCKMHFTLSFARFKNGKKLSIAKAFIILKKNCNAFKFKKIKLRKKSRKSMICLIIYFVFSTIKSNDCGSKSQECRPNL